MGEWRLFEAGTVPPWTTAEWYEGREHAPHLEQEEHRPRLLRSAQMVALAFPGFRPPSVVDLGAGDGGLLSLLTTPRKWGYDLMPTNVEAAKLRGVDVRLANVLEDDIDWGEIAVATEMLEHLLDPHAFVNVIAKHVRALVCSSPWVERPGNAYEFHTWCWDFEGYAALVEQAGFKVVRHAPVGGFQVMLAVKP